jgi:predicted transcriptional regulator
MFAAIEREGDKPDPTPRLSFISYELMHKVLAPNRMTIVQSMTGQGPLSIREVARRVGRDFKGVHSDVTTLLRNGVLEKLADGRVIFPYSRIHFDFEFGAANQSAA